MRWKTTTLAIALVMAACGGESSSGLGSTSGPTTTTQIPTTSSYAPSTTTTVGDLVVVVPPDADGVYPDDVMVTCHGYTFPIEALEDIGPVDETMSEAIAEFLGTGEGSGWPQEGWQLLYQTPDQADLVAKGANGLLAFITVADEGSGWEWFGASLPGGPCHLQFATPPGLNSVEWRLDPEAAPPSPESTTFEVILTESECASGQEIGDRLVGPQVVMTATQVFVAFATRPPEGDAFTCQSNPEMSYVVELPEAIGVRTLVEGLDVGISLEDYVD